MLLLPIAVIIAAALLTVSKPTTQPATPTPTPRELWNARGSNHYTMVVDTVALPVPRVGLELTVQDGEITHYTIIACEHPSEEYPESSCEPIRIYYTRLAMYTIEELFETADTCIPRTQAALSNCPAFVERGLQGFDNAQAMFEMGSACREYVRPENWICYAEYDPDYGYPSLITNYSPNLTDGGSIIKVRNVQIIQ
jgi:hypothetical protein